MKDFYSDNIVATTICVCIAVCVYIMYLTGWWILPYVAMTILLIGGYSIILLFVAAYRGRFD